MPLRTLIIAALAIPVMLLAGCTAAGAGRPVVSQASALPLPSPAVAPAGSPAAAATASLTQVPAAGFAGWRTYTDPAMGYSISLPPGVDFRAGTSPAGIYTARAQFALPGVPGYQGIVLRVEPNPGGQAAEAEIEGALARLYEAATQEQAPAAPGGLTAQAQPLTISGLAAVRAVPGGSPDNPDFTIVIPYRDKIYMLSPVHDLPYASIAPEAQALFDQIVASFEVAR